MYILGSPHLAALSTGRGVCTHKSASTNCRCLQEDSSCGKERFEFGRGGGLCGVMGRWLKTIPKELQNSPAKTIIVNPFHMINLHIKLKHNLPREADLLSDSCRIEESV